MAMIRWKMFYENNNEWLKMQRWCASTIDGAWDLSFYGSELNPCQNKRMPMLICFFEKEEDAVLFKLRWQ
jgi:hypothetical protein